MKQAVWCSGLAMDLYLGGTRFESQLCWVNLSTAVTFRMLINSQFLYLTISLHCVCVWPRQLRSVVKWPQLMSYPSIFISPFPVLTAGLPVHKFLDLASKSLLLEQSVWVPNFVIVGPFLFCRCLISVTQLYEPHDFICELTIKGADVTALLSTRLEPLNM